MKKKLIILLPVCALFLLVQPDLESNQRGEPIQTQIEKGSYVPGEPVTAANMKLLPIPIGTYDYCFYQSIQKVSNVVIGKFKIGEREILLIQDMDADGKVDLVAHWFIDLDRVDRESEPDKYCPAETFKKLKELIVNGKTEVITFGGQNYTISPNKEGITEIEKLIKVPSNITKYKEGLRIKKIDTDERSKEIMVFSFSQNTADNTIDMAFEVKYFYYGKSRKSPVINQGVYCLKSVDPFALETVKKLREMTAKYLPK